MQSKKSTIELDQKMQATFCTEAMIRGYHVYKDIWTAAIKKLENCLTADFFTVAVVRKVLRRDTTVGRFPRKISFFVHFFKEKKL